MSDHVEIHGVRLYLSSADPSKGEWIGQSEVLRQLLACWLTVDDLDLPLAPRLTGAPGIGKTTLAMAAAQTRKQDLYVYQCTSDTRPEDLLVTPVLAESGTIQYHASPLVTAMLTGSVCVLDEGNRMNEKSWASLAPLLDHRRYVESIVAGTPTHARPRTPVTRRRTSDSRIPPAIRQRRNAQPHRRIPATGTRTQTRLLDPRWHQYPPLCTQTTRCRPRTPALTRPRLGRIRHRLPR
jgi:MoxR-like ATPase